MLYTERPLSEKSNVALGLAAIRREPTSASGLCNWHGTVVGQQETLDSALRIVDNPAFVNQ
jgi:hypothetical protein